MALLSWKNECLKMPKLYTLVMCRKIALIWIQTTKITTLKAQLDVGQKVSACRDKLFLFRLVITLDSEKRGPVSKQCQGPSDTNLALDYMSFLSLSLFHICQIVQKQQTGSAGTHIRLHTHINSVYMRNTHLVSLSCKNSSR